MENNKFGTTSMVLGIIGMFFLWVPILNLILPIIALVYSAKQRKIEPNGMATAGLVLGIIGLVIAILFSFILVMTLISTFVLNMVRHNLEASQNFTNYTI